MYLESQLNLVVFKCGTWPMWAAASSLHRHWPQAPIACGAWPAFWMYGEAGVPRHVGDAVEAVDAPFMRFV